MVSVVKRNLFTVALWVTVIIENLESPSGRKKWDPPTSIYTKTRGPIVMDQGSFNGWIPKWILDGTKWRMFHGLPELPTQGGGFNLKPWHYDTSNIHNPWFIVFFLFGLTHMSMMVISEMWRHNTNKALNRMLFPCHPFHVDHPVH